jgi:hypothetical protein
MEDAASMMKNFEENGLAQYSNILINLDPTVL